MGGKGETVQYVRLFERGGDVHHPKPLTPEQKEILKDKVCRLIDSATFEITVETLLGGPRPPHA